MNTFLLVICWIVGVWLFMAIGTLIHAYCRHRDDIEMDMPTFWMLLVMHLLGWLIYVLGGLKWPEWR